MVEAEDRPHAGRGGAGRHLVSPPGRRVKSEILITNLPEAAALLAGRYRLESVLGRGAESTVCRAWDRVTANWVAIKTFAERAPRSSERARNFERELASVRRLDHPHIVRLLDHGETDDGPFLVTQLVNGGSLRDELGGRPVNPLSIGSVTDQVLGALEHAHGRGVVHRDVKPTNVLLERTREGDRHAWVCDFGLSVTTSIESWAGEPVAGTPIFMSPEQAVGDPVDGKSDVYSVGVLLFLALTGRPPFEGRGAVEVMKAHVAQPVPDLARSCPSAPADLTDLVVRMLAKDPRDRPTARAARDALRAALARPSTAPSRIDVPIPDLDVVPRPALEPPWPSAPPYERWIPPGAPTAPPDPIVADEPSLSRLWARYGRVRGDEPAGPAFWVRTSEGLILGPFDWLELDRVLHRERTAALAPEVWLSTDREDWVSIETFGAWTEQPHLMPGLAASEAEPASTSRLFARAGRLTADRGTGQLAVRLASSEGHVTWRAYLRRGEVVRFELADPSRTLPELARHAGELSVERIAADATRSVRERRSLWEVWEDAGFSSARGLRMRLLRVGCQALVNARVTSMAWTEGEPPWSGPPVAPSLSALLLHAAQVGQPRERWRRALEPHLDLRPEPTRELLEGLPALAPDEDALASIRILLGAEQLAEALELGAEPAVAYTVIATRWVRLAGAG